MHIHRSAIFIHTFPLQYKYFIRSYAVTITLYVRFCLLWLLIWRELFVQGPFVYFNPQITDLLWQSSKVRRPLTSLSGQVQGSAHVTTEVKSFWYMVQLINVSTTTFVSMLHKQYLVRLRTFCLLLNNINKQLRNVWWIWCILS